MQLDAPPIPCVLAGWQCVWEVSSADLDCGVAQLLRDSSLGVSWAFRRGFGCACGWDPADLLWLTRSCSSIYWKCRGACVGDVWAAPSWSGRVISPECGFAAYLQEPGERKPQLPAKRRREGDSAFASKSQCWVLILHFLCPWVLWLIRNPPGSLPCLFTLIQPVSGLLITDAGPGSLI